LGLTDTFGIDARAFQASHELDPKCIGTQLPDKSHFAAQPSCRAGLIRAFAAGK